MAQSRIPGRGLGALVVAMVCGVAGAAPSDLLKPAPDARMQPFRERLTGLVREVKRDNEGTKQVLSEHGVDIGSGTHVRILNVDIFRSDVDVRVVSSDSNHYGEEIYCFVPPNSGGQPMFSKVLQRVPGN